MIRAAASLARKVAGRPDRGGAQAEPLIAGYRRSSPSLLKVALLVLLVGGCFYYGFSFAINAPSRMMPFAIPLVAIGSILIWALPVGEYAPTRALAPLFLAFFVALILWPNYLAIALPSLPWVTLLRIIGVPMIAVLLACLSISPPFRRQLGRVLSSDPWLARLMLALVVLQTASIVFSRNPDASLNKWIIVQVNMTAVFIVGAYAFTRPGFVQIWAKMLLALMFVLCALGLWEGYLAHVPWAGHIPSFLRIEDETVLRVLRGAARSATNKYRVQGPSTTSLGMAEILGLGIPFALHLALEGRSLIMKALAAAFIPLCIYVIITTDSRLGMVAAVASGPLYLLVWALLKWRNQKSSFFGPAIVLAYPAILAAVITSTFVIGRLRARVWGDGSQGASTAAREAQWDMAWPKIFKNPIGYGIGQGGSALGYKNLAGRTTIDSYYISVLLELGVIGFFIYYGLFLRAMYISGRTVIDHPVDRDVRFLMPLAVSLMNFVIIKSVLSQDANHPFAFILLGAVVALTYRATKLSEDANRSQVAARFRAS